MFFFDSNTAKIYFFQVTKSIRLFFVNKLTKIMLTLENQWKNFKVIVFYLNHEQWLLHVYNKS